MRRLASHITGSESCLFADAKPERFATVVPAGNPTNKGSTSMLIIVILNSFGPAKLVGNPTPFRGLVVIRPRVVLWSPALG
jgi:hypothetical protein